MADMFNPGGVRLHPSGNSGGGFAVNKTPGFDPRPHPHPIHGGGGGTPPPPTPAPYTFGPQAVRATAPGSQFDPAYAQNLANFGGGELARPSGSLSFNPFSMNPYQGFGNQLGGGNAPLYGLPDTLLQQAMQSSFLNNNKKNTGGGNAGAAGGGGLPGGGIATGGQSSGIWDSLYGNTAFGGGPTAFGSFNAPGTLWDTQSGFGNPAVNSDWGAGCFTPDTEVKGVGELGQYHDGDTVAVVTKTGAMKMAKVIVHDDYDALVHIINDEGWAATPEHKFWHDGAWVEAQEIFSKTKPYKGKIYNLHVITEQEDERNYQLGTGHWVHNKDTLTPWWAGVSG